MFCGVVVAAVMVAVDARWRTHWLRVQDYSFMKPLSCHWAIEHVDQFPML